MRACKLSLSEEDSESLPIWLSSLVAPEGPAPGAKSCLKGMSLVGGTELLSFGDAADGSLDLG